MATVQPRTPIMSEKIWTEEEKEEWFAANGAEPTHVVTFEPMYEFEVCIPPWEHPERQIVWSAVVVGQEHGRRPRSGAPRWGRRRRRGPSRKFARGQRAR